MVAEHTQKESPYRRLFLCQVRYMMLMKTNFQAIFKLILLFREEKNI